LLTRLGKLELKPLYQGNFQFRFWAKQFMALALIPIENDGKNILEPELHANI